MHTTLTRSGSLALAVALSTALGACTTRRDTAARNETAATTDTTAARPGTGLDTTAAGGAVAMDSAARTDWTDTDILAYLDAANNGEIEAGKLAERKATTAPVKAFARRMVTDHTAMLKEGQRLAKQLNADVATATQEDVKDLAQESKDALQDLTQKQAGRDWDEDYLQKQIDAHQKVLDKLNEFANAAQNAELKAAIQQAIPKVQAHLRQAQDLKSSGVSS
jgi:putative membrane protein